MTRYMFRESGKITAARSPLKSCASPPQRLRSRAIVRLRRGVQMRGDGRGRQRSRWAPIRSRLSAGDEAAIRARRLDVPTVRLELVLEAANADLQEPRGFRTIAVNLVERAQDVAALDL